MRFTPALITLASILSVTALQPEDVPVEIAVRSDAYVLTSPNVGLTSRNGNIQHFYERDEEQYFIQRRGIEEREAKDLSKDPQSDTYAVQADAGGNLAPL